MSPKELNLPGGFEWSTIDVKDDQQCKDLSDFLATHYLFLNGGTFASDETSISFIRWNFNSPHYNPSFLVGIRASASKKLMGFIAGHPITINLRDDIVDSLEIKFLCVHPKLHGNRMSTVLFNELKRRAVLAGKQVAAFVTKETIAKPMATSTYWSRPLNIKKVLATGFLQIPAKMTFKQFERIHQIKPIEEL